MIPIRLYRLRTVDYGTVELRRKKLGKPQSAHCGHIQEIRDSAILQEIFILLRRTSVCCGGLCIWQIADVCQNPRVPMVAPVVVVLVVK